MAVRVLERWAKGMEEAEIRHFARSALDVIKHWDHILFDYPDESDEKWKHRLAAEYDVDSIKNKLRHEMDKWIHDGASSERRLRKILKEEHLTIRVKNRSYVELNDTKVLCGYDDIDVLWRQEEWQHHWDLLANGLPCGCRQNT